jgi:putative ABC transport system permease protein
LGLKIIQGRKFSEEFTTDRTEAIILNESAVKSLGITNPVGKKVYLPGGKDSEQLAEIIGVMNNFHITSFRKKIEPMFLYINPNYFYNIALKIDQQHTNEIISSLNDEWLKILPGTQFDYSFLSQTYDNLYESEAKSGRLFSIFSFLSIFIACMGLFGLVSYIIEVRIKEIGVRKVLGADLPGITLLLSKDFIKWVLIANVIAIPAAYYAISKWMENFAYKTEIGFEIFIFSGLIALLIALLTVGFKAIKAAAANPIDSLRYE